MTTMMGCEMKLTILIISIIDGSVKARYKNCHGTLALLLGSATFIEGSTKLHHILNRMGLTQSYDAVADIRSRLTTESLNREKGNLLNVPTHDISVFSIDNSDQTNFHGLTVTGKGQYGLHSTSTKVVLCNVLNHVPMPARTSELSMTKGT